MVGFTGYHGGFAALQVNMKFPSSVLQRRAMKRGIVHAGGTYSKDIQQFNYTRFMHPIMKHAVENGAQRLLYLITENSQGNNKYSPNCAMLGTYDDVISFVSEYTQTKPHVGVYYYHKDPAIDDRPSPVKVFLDVDANVSADIADPFTHTYTEVQKAIDIINDSLSAMITEADAPPLTYSICYNQRADGPGKTKCSFHVTWHHHAFETQQQQRDFMVDMIKDKVSFVDFKVYTNGRLMRIPFTGKGGSSDAILRPITVKWCTKTKQWKYEITKTPMTPEVFHAFNICPYQWEQENYTFHSYNKTHNDSRGVINVVGNRAGRDTSPIEASVDVVQSEAMMQFFRPIMISVITKRIQEHRASLLSLCKGRDMRAGVPTTSFEVTQPKLGWRTGCYTFNVTGDTFCEHDTTGSTPYYHENENKTKIQINLRAGYYTQLCYNCPNNEKTKWAIFGPSCIKISPYEEKFSFRTLDMNKEESTALYLQYWQDDIIYNPSVDHEFFVYHNKTKTWRCLEQTLHTKRLQMRDAYIRYRIAWFMDEHNFRMRKLDERIAAGDAKPDEKQKAECKAKCELKRLQSLQPFHTEPTKFIKSIQAAYEFTTGSDDCDMDVIPHLVPLKGGECYDVLNDCNVMVEKHMRISSCLNASMCMTMDEDCRAIQDWFLEVSKGRKDLAQYLKRVIGLCMTRIKVDRKFYCNLGREGRNGKSVLFEILQVTHTHTTRGQKPKR